MPDKCSIFPAAMLTVLAGCAGPQLLAHDPAPEAKLDPVTCPYIAINGALQVQYPAKAFESGQEGGCTCDSTSMHKAPPPASGSSGEPARRHRCRCARTLQHPKFLTAGMKGCEFVLEYRKDAPK